MLSNEEFVKSVVDKIYPDARKLENECLKLFNKQFSPGIGLTGFKGYNELDYTIQLLNSSVALLKRIAKEQNIKIID